MKVFTFDQYTPEWWAARRGVPTASEFNKVMTPKKMELAAAAEGYIHRLIGDRLDPHYPRVSEYVSPAMQQGSDREKESRDWYEMERGLDVRKVWFCLSDDGRFGASPDGLVGDDGTLELKNPQPDTQVRYLLSDANGPVLLPDEYLCQVHGQLIVTGRAWVDFLSYCPGLPSFLVRVYPNEFTARLAEALETFWPLYQAAWKRIQALDGRAADAA